MTSGAVWPGEAEFGWQRDRGITSFFAHDVRDRGIRAVVEEAIAVVGAGPELLTVDVDVLDPSTGAVHRSIPVAGALAIEHVAPAA